MTDRELLEAAAKAAGIELVRSRLDDSLCRDMLTPAIDGRGIGWNPLTDDGDALRLAVTLRLDVYFHESGAVVNAENGRTFDENTNRADPAAGARRAIVRAAAATEAA